MHVFDETGVYDIDLSVSNKFGCKSTIEKLQMIDVLERPNADFLPDESAVPISKPIVFIENLSDLDVTGFWDFGDGTILEGDYKTLSHTYTDTGIYSITLVVEREYADYDPGNPFVCFDTLTLDVHVYEENLFFAPNAFNPFSLNPDNAIFNPSLYGEKITDYHLVIMDRWGEKVYETFSLDHGWDGKIKNGDIGSPDVYSWIVKFTDINNRQQIRTGAVALVR